ncbi:MAG: adenine phosphoribosyltransferase [Myxococcota bacterium]
MSDERTDRIRALIRNVPDFPKPGVQFKDISPLLADPEGFTTALDLIAEAYAGKRVDTIVGIESRGFIFGAALAARMSASFVPARKPGKLPAETVRQSYELEYGSDAVEIHADALERGERVVIVDDLIATGGTARATGDLVLGQGAELLGYAFVIELGFLGGVERLAPHHVVSLLAY